MPLAPPPDDTRVSTLPFEIDPSDFFRLLVNTHFRGNVWTYVLLGGLVVLGLGMESEFLFTTGIALGVGLAVYRLMEFRDQTHGPDSALNVSLRRYDLTQEALHLATEEGVEVRIPLTVMTRAENDGEFWTLCIGSSQFNLVPLSAFASPGDLATFESVLREHGLVT